MVTLARDYIYCQHSGQQTIISKGAGGMETAGFNLATLTEALPWTVTIRDGDDAVVATGRGTGTAVDWTWDASGDPIRRLLLRDRGRPRPPARSRDGPRSAAARR